MDSFSEKTDVSKPDVAASYQFAIVEILVEKMKRAIDKTGVKTCVIAGGVAANLSLRSTLEKRLKGVKILLPDLKYCTDNAAMIAYLGELKSQNNKYEKLDFPIYPNLKLAK